MSEDRVYQASPATCVRVAREALKAAHAELLMECPNLGHAIDHIRRGMAWLPGHLEDEWDATMASWLYRENERIRKGLD